jgi:hypothetical protein
MRSVEWERTLPIDQQLSEWLIREPLNKTGDFLQNRPEKPMRHCLGYGYMTDSQLGLWARAVTRRQL